MTPVSASVIRSNKQIAAGAYILAFDRDFEFTPGQVIGLSNDLKTEPRLYSIASSNTNPQVQILYTVKPEGSLTPALASLKAGQKIYHSLPFGKFICSKDPAFWIATGTGIAPFASMIFSGLSDNKTLVYGNRFADRLYFHQQISQVMKKRYLPCVTRQQSPGMFHGRVTDLVRNMDGLDPAIPYYLCGSAEMVVDMRDLLIEMGVPYENVIAEIFF